MKNILINLIPSSLLASLILATGCVGSAQIQAQDDMGGVLSLKGNEAKAQQDAEVKMASHCGPGNYRVTRKERVVVGQENYQNSQGDYTEERQAVRDEQVASQSGSSSDYGRTWNGDYVDQRTQESGVSSSQSAERTDGQTYNSSVSGTRNVSEFRIHYACGAGQSGNSQGYRR